MRLRGRLDARRSISGLRKRPRSNAAGATHSVCQRRNITVCQFRGIKPITTTPSERFIACAREFFVEEYLPKIERCLERLTDEQIWWRPNEESNSIGNLVLHLCGNARQWIVSGVGGEEFQRERDAEFAQRELVPRDQLVTLLRSTIEDVARVLRGLDPATLLERRSIQGSDVDVLEAIFHVTEHFSMHTGQIIMLTKMLTGSDLRFYDFSGGGPRQSWSADSSG